MLQNNKTGCDEDNYVTYFKIEKKLFSSQFQEKEKEIGYNHEDQQ